MALNDIVWECFSRKYISAYDKSVFIIKMLEFSSEIQVLLEKAFGVLPEEAHSRCLFRKCFYDLKTLLNFSVKLCQKHYWVSDSYFGSSKSTPKQAQNIVATHVYMKKQIIIRSKEISISINQYPILHDFVSINKIQLIVKIYLRKV